MKAVGYLTKPWLVWLTGCACLLTLGIAAELTRPYPNLSEVLSHPQKYDGQQVPLLVECRIAEVFSGGFVVQQMGMQLIAHTSEENLHEGEYVVVDGVFHAPNTLEVTRLHVARNRRWKMAVSLAPILILGLLLWRNVDFDMKYFRFKLRNSADA